MLNVLLRRFFNMPIYGSTEIVRYISLACASFAIVEHEWVNGNINMPIILDAVPKKVRAIMLCTGYIIATGVFTFISYLLIRQVMNRYTFHSVSPDLGITLWIPALVLSIGFIAMTLTIIVKAVICGWMVKTGNNIVFERLRKD